MARYRQGKYELIRRTLLDGYKYVVDPLVMSRERSFSNTKSCYLLPNYLLRQLVYLPFVQRYPEPCYLKEMASHHSSMDVRKQETHHHGLMDLSALKEEISSTQRVKQ